MKFTKQFLSLLFIATLLFACSKGDDQPRNTGAQGPTGPPGFPGTDGTQGAQGPQGEPGTANVIYSAWFVTELGSDITISADEFVVDAPELDGDMLNFGTILVFARRLDVAEGGNLVYQLPISFGAFRQQSYYFEAGYLNIRIYVIANQPGEDAGDGTFLEQYRYILIPGGNPASGKSADPIDYTKMTYEEVVAHFTIPD